MFSYSARPTGPICITEIQMSLEAEDMSLVLLIKFHPRHSPQDDMEFWFKGVRDLRFHGNPTILGGVVVLKIEDMLSSGWERIQYRVKDDEEEFISFFCSDLGPCRDNNKIPS